MGLRQKHKGSQAGFTLIEIMIAMAIMIMISFAIFQTTSKTFELRNALSSEASFYNGIELATLILQRDISTIYTPTLMIANSNTGGGGTPDGGTLGDGSGGGDEGQSFKFWSKPVDAGGLRPSHFIGTETTMSFVALSHVRVYKDSPESEFAKITYSLERDTSNSGSGKSDTQVLVKTEDPQAFIYDETRFSQMRRKVRKYKILSGIQKLSFVYYQKEDETWKPTKSWDTDREETRNRFPDYIEVQLELKGEGKETFQGAFKFRPEIPINGGPIPSY